MTTTTESNQFKGIDCSNLDMRKKQSQQIMKILIETGVCPCCDKKIHEGLNDN